MGDVRRFNKATAAAVVTVLAWLLGQFGLDLSDGVQGALTVLLVYAVPNSDTGGDSDDLV